MLAAALLAATLSVEDYATMPQLSSPRWSPDGKQIAYVVTQADLGRAISAYDSDVWLIDADGANDRRLTFANGTDTHPRWSPDGTRLAFLSDRGGRNAIWLIDPRGGEPRALTGEPTPVREFEWSPDGKQIAFTRIDAAPDNDGPRVVGADTRQLHLYTVDVATAKVRRPLVVRPGHDRAPKFSPDGKSIAFTSAGGVAHWLVEFDLHVVPEAGGTPRRISAAYDRTPDNFDWAADGRTLWVEGPWNSTVQLFRVNTDGSGFTDATKWEGTVTDPAVSATNRIAAIRQTLTSPPELFAGRIRRTAWRSRACSHSQSATRAAACRC